jgi:uncharacterized membrane protein
VAAAYDWVLGVHIIGVVLAFGWTFALPLMFAVAARSDPRSVPLLHRIEYTATRWLLNPALTVVLGAGIFMAIDGHHWGDFFVQWGIGAIVVLGALAGSVMIPLSKRAEQAALADVLAAGGEPPQPSEAYRAIVRRLQLWGSAMWLLVLATVLIMAAKP